MSAKALKESIVNAIKTNNVYMFVFVGFAIGFFIIFSLLLALTDQAKTCVSDKDLTNTGYVFSSFGIAISVALLVLAIMVSKNMNNLIQWVRSRK